MSDDMEISTKTEQNSRKRIRHRKKQLYDNILKQVEFYFSDANLSKDRFLGEMIKSDPYVPIDIFLKFNKIRAMSQEVSDIAKALKSSKLLECSEDMLKVKRKSPLMPYNADQRTIYVESIPATASRDWLQSVFKDYGPVAYISLPKFKHTERIKGYAFVEFVKPEDAQNCLTAFTKMGCKLPTCMPPEELSTIKMFAVEEPPDDEQVGAGNPGVGDLKKVEEIYEPPMKKQKRHKDKKPPKSLDLKIDKELEDEVKDATSTPIEDESSVLDTSLEDASKSDVESKEGAKSHDETTTVIDGPPQKKKNRKRTAKERSKSKNGVSKNEAPKGALWGLQVLSKQEWKSLRNKYLNLQRKHMKELKASLRSNMHGHPPMPAVPTIEIVSDPMQKSDAEGSQPTVPLEQIPGIFLKAELAEPCCDVRLAKRQVRSNIHVQHVDVKEGQTEMVIRFDSAEAAQQYCLSGVCEGALVLEGADEAAQWARVEAARAGKRVRGRCRLLQRADAAERRAPVAAPAHPQPTATHLRFDE